MKTQIDALVRGILHDLAQPAPAYPELIAFFLAIGADGYTKAVTKRGILASYVADINLSAEVRMYAQQQLGALPTF